ncbi:MAG: hypothetical protein FJ107_08840 [Deltaproteobacteria bacterium]|nr:hypothetical protein [Deltaproteobacteria bacterium]MBM4348224.1 hypothetical protein [Deltaproteobacteria bacterium]
MSRYLQKEVKTLRENIMTCFRETEITDKSFTSLFLSIIWLHALVDQEGKTEDPKERRRIIHEFRRRTKALKKGIRYVYEQAERRTTQPTASLQQ